MERDPNVFKKVSEPGDLASYNGHVLCSASVIDRDTMGSFLALQETLFDWTNIQYPEVERLVSDTLPYLPQKIHIDEIYFELEYVYHSVLCLYTENSPNILMMNNWRSMHELTKKINCIS